MTELLRYCVTALLRCCVTAAEDGLDSLLPLPRTVRAAGCMADSPPPHRASSPRQVSGQADSLSVCLKGGKLGMADVYIALAN